MARIHRLGELPADRAIGLKFQCHECGTVWFSEEGDEFVFRHPEGPSYFAKVRTRCPLCGAESRFVSLPPPRRSPQPE